MRRALLLSALMSLSLVACDEGQGTPDLDTTPRDTELPPGHPHVNDLISLATARGSGRLSVSQLRKSLPVVAGVDASGENGITWGRLEANATALGEADFETITIENYDPSPLYAKFMDDAARDVCAQMLSAEAGDAPAKTLYRFVEKTDTVESNPAGVDQNLRYLKLRFHGVRVADDDTESIAPLRMLFARAVEAAQGSNATASESHVREGWRLVCVAMMTSAEFHIY